MNNRRITIREVAEDDEITIDSCHDFFFKYFLGMKRASAKFVEFRTMANRCYSGVAK